MAKKGPCWKGYEMIGMKTKNGRSVPNCVKKANVGLHAETKEKKKVIPGDPNKRRKYFKNIQNPKSEYDKKGKLTYTSAYLGKFIKHDSAGIELSNKNSMDYYGDLLK